MDHQAQIDFLLGRIASSYGRELTADQKELVLSLFAREKYKKKARIFMNGETNTRHYFVVKGLIRLYLIDYAGKEFNVLFAREGQILGDLASPGSTMFNLDTIEDTVVYSITNENLERLRTEFSDAVALDSNSMLKRSYIFLQQRFVSILSRTAEENYLELKEHYPELIQRLPQYHIASYLGIRPEFLSKIVARQHRRSRK